jgi:hypothetical protein
MQQRKTHARRNPAVARAQFVLLRETPQASAGHRLDLPEAQVRHGAAQALRRHRMRAGRVLPPVIAPESLLSAALAFSRVARPARPAAGADALDHDFRCDCLGHGAAIIGGGPCAIMAFPRGNMALE